MSVARKIAAVVGATGVQGGSVAKELLKRGGWTVRAITRSPDGDAAKSLKSQGAEIVNADIHNSDDLKRAFAGANVVFVNTVSQFHEGAHAAEEKAGKLMVDIAKEQNVSHFVYSSEENANAVSKGALKLPMFTAKANIEEYMFKSGLPSSAVQMATYMENFTQFMQPRKNADGVYEFTFSVSSDSKFPLICAAELGQVVLKLFENKDKYVGKKLFVAGDYLTPNQVVATMAKVWKVPVKHNYVPAEEFAKRPFPGAADLAEMYVLWDKYGHAGEKVNNQRDVFEAKRECPSLSTLEQWLVKNMPTAPANADVK